MKKIIFIIIVFFSMLNFNVYSDEKKCGAFDFACKTKKFIDDTKEFQKKGLEDSKSQIKNIPDNLKQK